MTCPPGRAVLVLELILAPPERQDDSPSLPWGLCTSLVLFTLYKINSPLLNLLCVSYCDKHRGWRLAPERKGNVPLPQSSLWGSGLPLPSTHVLLK